MPRNQSSLSNNFINIILMVALLLAWGVSWPFIKMALVYIPPLWLGVARLASGAGVLFIYLGVRGKLSWPRGRDLPLVLSIGILQMGGYTALINLGLMHVDASRSVILAYTTPLWVVPIALIFFKEKLNRRTVIGLVIGFTGILLLFNPLTFDWSNQQLLLSNGLLLLAALVWAVVILHIRYAHWHSTPLALAPWQMLIATVLLVLLACTFEPHPHINWTGHFLALMLYLGPIASAGGFLAATIISRRLKATTTSLVMLAIPVTGMISSMSILREHLALNQLLALITILIGLACLALPRKDNK